MKEGGGGAAYVSVLCTPQYVALGCDIFLFCQLLLVLYECVSGPATVCNTLELYKVSKVKFIVDMILTICYVQSFVCI